MKFGFDLEQQTSSKLVGYAWEQHWKGQLNIYLKKNKENFIQNIYQIDEKFQKKLLYFAEKALIIRVIFATRNTIRELKHKWNYYISLSQKIFFKTKNASNIICKSNYLLERIFLIRIF